MPLTDRYLANDTLSELIETSNEKGSSRPRDER